MIDIDAIIERRDIVSFFQPLVSIKKKAVIGFEALSRGVGAEGLIPPCALFDMAAKKGRRVDFDRLCRSSAFSRFKPHHERERSLLLSVNLDVRILDTEAAGSNYLLRQVMDYGLNPNNVIIEMLEADVQNTQALLDFIEKYRGYGFLIAIDDVGAGHSNLERIAYIKPDVLKIDRSLISEIDKGYHKREVVKSLTTLGRKIGSLIVAEGVERQEEAVLLMELGVDIFQGYYFARPIAPEMDPCGLPHTIAEVGGVFKEYMLQKISRKRSRFAVYNTLVSELAGRLADLSQAEYDRTLVDFLALQAELECLYVLDMDGAQISNTVCNPYHISESRRFIYQPAQKGADHSLKEYYLPIKAGLPRYTTEEYTSLASGNRCTTIALVFDSRERERAILCVDISSLEVF
jgi:EAL domain-containing protein (putative c-di-GMP-specific phosphodiesterase class I)